MSNLPPEQATALSALKPGDGWRLLAPNELVVEGDEVFMPSFNAWERSTNWSFRNGIQAPDLTYRRRLIAEAEPVEATKPVAHTPGPWKAELADLYDQDDNRWSVLTDYGGGRDYFIATIENGVPGDTLDTEAVNARVLAASPLMLEVLREVASPAWPDSDLANLLQTLRCRAQAVIDKVDACGVREGGR